VVGPSSTECCAGPPKSAFALARYHSNGTLDSTFGRNGKVTTNFEPNSYDLATALVLQPDGKIVVPGTSNDGIHGYAFVVARYGSDGILDPTFGRNGEVTTRFGCTSAAATAVAIQPNDGQIVVAGNTSGNSANTCGPPDVINFFALARYHAFTLANEFVTLDGTPETAFAPTPVPGSSAGTFTIRATFTNTSVTPLRFPFFTVTELSGSNLVLNADEGGPQGLGATVTLQVGDNVLSPGETVAVDFVIGLQKQVPFAFFIDLFAEPLR
jgi:uncharacterized delta-60 repeat protein